MQLDGQRDTHSAAEGVALADVEANQFTRVMLLFSGGVKRVHITTLSFLQSSQQWVATWSGVCLDEHSTTLKATELWLLSDGATTCQGLARDRVEGTGSLHNRLEAAAIMCCALAAAYLPGVSTCHSMQKAAAV